MNNDEYTPMSDEEIIEIFKVLEIEDEEKRLELNQRLLVPDSNNNLTFETKTVGRIEIPISKQKEL